MELDFINGQTPLDEDEKDGLLIPSIATRGELDEFELRATREAAQAVKANAVLFHAIGFQLEDFDTPLQLV